MKFRLILCAALTAGFCLAAGPAQAAPLIGYVDLQKAITSVEEGQAARAKLQKTLEKKQKALTKKKNSLDALTKKLSAGNVTPSDRQKFNKQAEELKKVFLQEQAELQKLERKELGQIITRMKKVIKDIGKAGGYTIILEVQTNRLLYAPQHLDLTNEVIRKYNASRKSKKKK